VIVVDQFMHSPYEDLLEAVYWILLNKRENERHMHKPWVLTTPWRFHYIGSTTLITIEYART
jgi:hypothetical protein